MKYNSWRKIPRIQPNCLEWVFMEWICQAVYLIPLAEWLLLWWWSRDSGGDESVMWKRAISTRIIRIIIAPILSSGIRRRLKDSRLRVVNMTSLSMTWFSWYTYITVRRWKVLIYLYCFFIRVLMRELVLTYILNNKTLPVFHTATNNKPLVPDINL